MLWQAWTPASAGATIMLFLVAILSMSLIAAPKPQVFKSGPAQVSLLELYTSEGCHSCPPADKWFGTLKSSKNLWSSFVPVAFHVDYWNYIGWPDPFSKSEFTRRQRQYARAWRATSVYTPGFVFNGKEWKGWYNRTGIPSRKGNKVGELKISFSKGNNANLLFKPTNSKSEWTAHLAILGMDLVSQVTAGENKGKTLHHDFVVLGFDSTELQKTGAGWQTSFQLSEKAKAQSKKLALAAWVTEKGEITPVQAVGGWLQ